MLHQSNNPGLRAAGFMAAMKPQDVLRRQGAALRASVTTMRYDRSTATTDSGDCRTWLSRRNPVVSVVIKARNEGKQIGECVESMRGFADEVIVVDDGSEDDTKAVAEAAGARVIAARSQDGEIEVLDRYGFDVAQGQWILRVDADERMTPSLAKKLTEVVRAGRYSGVRYARKNIMFGGWARHGGWFRADQLRFFRADAWDRNFDFALHAMPPIHGEVLTLPATEDLATIHYDYDSIGQFIQRSLRGYALIEARRLSKQGRSFSPLRLILKPLRMFFGRYLLRQGFRDGVRGLILAGLLAGYQFSIEANLWDLQRRRTH